MGLLFFIFHQLCTSPEVAFNACVNVLYASIGQLVGVYTIEYSVNQEI